MKGTVEILDPGYDAAEILAWLNTNIGPHRSRVPIGDWRWWGRTDRITGKYYYCFKYPRDAMLFKLIWVGSR